MALEEETNGRKAGSAGGPSGAWREGIGAQDAPHPSPSPSMRQRHSQGSTLLFHGGPALPPHSRSSCPSQQGARGPLCRGFISRLLLQRAAGAPGHRVGQEGPQRLESGSERRALFPHAVSRRRQLAAGDV